MYRKRSEMQGGKGKDKGKNKNRNDKQQQERRKAKKWMEEYLEIKEKRKV